MLTFLRQKTRPALPPRPRKKLSTAVASIFDRAPGPTVAADGTQVALLDCTPDPTITASLKTAQYAKLGTSHPEGFRQSAGEGYTRMDVAFSVCGAIVENLGTAAPALGLPHGPLLVDALEREKEDRDGKPWNQILASQVSEHSRHARSCWTSSSYQTPAYRAAQGNRGQSARHSTPAGRKAQGERNSTPGGREAQAERATKKPSLDPKINARREKDRERKRKAAEMTALGYVNIGGGRGKPTKWGRPGEQA